MAKHWQRRICGTCQQRRVVYQREPRGEEMFWVPVVHFCALAGTYADGRPYPYFTRGYNEQACRAHEYPAKKKGKK